MRNPRLEDDYRELNLQPGASLDQVRTSYRELALLWHPDRRSDGQGRASRAHERMTRINLAYERLRKALERNTDAKSNSEPAPRHRPPSQPSQNRHSQGTRGSHRGPRPSQEIRTNTLAMRFVPVEGTEVFFSIWQTRVQDYRAYAE